MVSRHALLIIRVLSFLFMNFPNKITGGSLTAWGVTQTKTRYKVAVVGAAATHWETMVTESASPELEVRIHARL
jgi:hypothetical protein